MKLTKFNHVFAYAGVEFRCHPTYPKFGIEGYRTESFYQEGIIIVYRFTEDVKHEEYGLITNKMTEEVDNETEEK